MPGASASPTFADLLRRARIAAGLTQETLAERAGLSARGIQHLEQDERHPTTDTLARLVLALGLDGDARTRFEAAGQPRPRPAIPSSGEAAAPVVQRHNLPPQLTSFIGRGQELADLRRLLASTRLVTVTGVGGCGKTRLALHLAADVLGDYADGVWFVDLAPLVDPALVPRAVASALGVGEAAGRPLLQTLLYALGSRHVMLVLDNCEHLLDACARLADAVLRGCPRVSVLATSREALGIAGEVAWRAPSLTLPGEEKTAAGTEPGRVPLGSEAVRLFADRAKTADARFDVTPATRTAIAQICRRLDGIPLAIELAAVRLKVLSVEQMEARLDDRFRLLTGGSRTALPRQQTLRATLDWSYTLLGEPERRLLRRLSVFAGGWTLDAAEAVCADDAPSLSYGPNLQHPAFFAQDDVLDLLAQLVDKSLVLVDKDAGEPRYRLLETVRQYGRDRLVEAEEAPGVRERHRDWCLGLAERAEPELVGPRQGEWLDVLEVERDNLRAALAWTLGSRDAELGLRLAGALGWWWVARDYWSEGRDWLERALAVPGAEARTAARAKALESRGFLAEHLGDVATMRRVYEECLAICREIGDRRLAAWAVRQLGQQALKQRDAAQAETLFAEALAQAREVGDRWVLASALEGLGMVAADRREYASSRRLLAESLEVFRAIADGRALAWVLLEAGTVAVEQGDCALARAWFLEALAIQRALRSPAKHVFVLGNLGIVTRIVGDTQGSRGFLAEALAIARSTGIVGLIGQALVAHALAARAAADIPQAQELVVDALKLVRESEADAHIRTVLLELCGVLAVERGADRRGVRILGAATTVRPVRLFWLGGTYRAKDEALELAKARMGEEALAVAWAEGQTMAPEQAVAEALDECWRPT